MKLQTSSLMAVAVMTSMTLVSCDWVDSTSQQAPVSADSSVPPTTPIQSLDDIPSGDAIVINEALAWSTTIRRQSAANLEQTFTWSEQPVEQGNLPECAGQEGFNPEYVANTLQDACTDPSDCELEIDTLPMQTDPELVQIELNIPTLKAPVGLRYILSAEDTSGARTEQERNFCLIAINEAPYFDNDDEPLSFDVGDEGDILTITSAMQGNLLSDAKDDIDVSNSPLVILTEAAVDPQYADLFELDAEGGFTYISRDENLSEDRTDTFTYVLYDGTFKSEQTVTINIIAGNQPPRIISAVGDLNVPAGTTYTFDFSEYVTDPENDTLTFSTDPNVSLPDDFELSPSGLLVGEPESGLNDRIMLSLIASDGDLETTLEALVVISANPSPDGESLAESGSDSDDESGNESDDESGSDSDDESGSDSDDESGSDSDDESGSDSDDESGSDSDDESGSDSDDESGSDSDDESGTDSDDESGSDSDDESGSDSDDESGNDSDAEGEINNSPVFIGFGESDVSQTLRVGEAMDPIIPEFTDEDDLTYSMRPGISLPPGITIDKKTGVISGSPTRVVGNRSGLRIRATDSDGQTKDSGRISLTVLRG